MSLFPLGLISQGGGAGGGAAFELISTAYGTGSSGTITFSSIPQTYKHLQIRIAAANNSGSTVTIVPNFNGDTASNYSAHWLAANGSSVSSSGSPSNTIQGIIMIADGSSAVSPMIMDILDYSDTNKYKTMKSFFGYTASPYELLRVHSANWRNTAAITSISLVAAAGSYTSNSRFSLYGVKGS